MATTDQRAGFRLPWATSPQTEDGLDSDASGLAVSPVDEAAPALAGGPSAAETIDTPWPTSDASDQAAALNGSPVTDTKQTAAPRHINPLMAGLVRAMRDAAEAARQEAIATLDEAAKARMEQIRAESTANDAETRRSTEHDIAEIREWSKTQMSRLRAETDERIATRHRRVELEAEEHAARVELRLDHVQAAVAAYGSNMDEFFRTLMAEDDPARLAGFAEQLPEPPDLLDERGLADWAPSRTLDDANAEAAEAAALSDIDPAAFPDADGDEPETGLAEGVTPDAEPPVTDQDMTRVSVVGLISVASITGFKRALAKVAGVESVSVSSGPRGDFIFTIQHRQNVDFGKVMAELVGFEATIQSSLEGVLSVTASERAGLGATEPS